MIVSINQPAYLPWLGYFHRIAVSDIHVVLDHVQFEKNSYTNRNKIWTPKGWMWLTVPVRTKGRFKQLSIDSLEINNQVDWRPKHWRSIKQNYKKTVYFFEHLEFYEDVYSQEWRYLSNLCQKMTQGFLDMMKITTPILYSSEMNLTGQKDKLILEICQNVGAKTYVSGSLGRNYLQKSIFQDVGIEILYQDYVHPIYHQYNSSKIDFQPYMSIIDLLYNCGKHSFNILMADQPPLS